MPSLVVGGNTIKVAPGGISRDRIDNVDRGRAFDNSYKASQSGTPKKDYHFTTPPIPRSDADFYELVLSQVGAVACSGDIIGGSYNQISWSDDFTNAAWVKSASMTVTPGIADPLGGTAANTLTASGAGQNALQTLSAINSAQRTNSLWMRRRTGSGNINLYGPEDITFTTVGLSSTWTRFSTTGAASTARKFDVVVTTSGDAIDVWGAQLQEGTAVTSYQKTTTVEVQGSTVNCCPEITGWTPLKASGAQYVTLNFVLHEV